jgi:hypothetical protein
VNSAVYTITLPAAAPAFSPAGGTYTSAQTVTISTTTPSATIHYTTNGATPTSSSSVYAGPITVSATETLKAIAVATGASASPVNSAVYTITLPPAAPAFSPAAGTYSSTQTVTISSTTSSATFYYTTDGATPTTNSPVYIGPITVSATETLKAIAVVADSANGMLKDQKAARESSSSVSSAVYTITPPTAAPAFSPAAGTYSSAQKVTISAATPKATIYYTTNGATPTTSSPIYAGPITVATTETVKAIAVVADGSASKSAIKTNLAPITSQSSSARYVVNLPTPTLSAGVSPAH